MEGLLVFVQSTRLVLFEFFTRFLRADGRLFRPLHGPNPANRRAVQSRY
jgi:V/A-type H+-transporting ATPase subunit I